MHLQFQFDMKFHGLDWYHFQRIALLYPLLHMDVYLDENRDSINNDCYIMARFEAVVSPYTVKKKVLQ